MLCFCSRLEKEFWISNGFFFILRCLFNSAVMKSCHSNSELVGSSVHGALQLEGYIWPKEIINLTEPNFVLTLFCHWTAVISSADYCYSVHIRDRALYSLAWYEKGIQIDSLTFIKLRQRPRIPQQITCTPRFCVKLEPSLRNSRKRWRRTL